MEPNTHSVDVGAEDFAQRVLAESQQRPVLVDFWAEWCGPCQQLLPLLDRLAEEFQGAFLLAKVNIDQQQALAQEFGVRSVPTVKVFRQGEVVDEFLGAQPEGQLRELLRRHIPQPADLLLQEAIALHHEHQPQAALERVAEALSEDPQHLEAMLTKLELLAAYDQHEAARAWLEQLPAEARQSEIGQRIATGLAIQDEAAAAGDAEQLRHALAQQPDDLALRFRWANLLAAQEAYAEAMEELLEILRRDREFQDQAPRRRLIDLFNLLGGSDPRVRETRRRLASLLN